MSKAGVSVERIRYIMNSPEEKDREGALSGEADAPMDRDISFEHVTWSYGPDLPRVLDDVSFTVPAGQTFGILGATGSGKSTLMLLLDRMYELPEGSGKITIGGVDIADMKRGWLRGNIGMVLQDPFLFSRTIAVNIGMTSEKPSMEAIRAAARTAVLDETVMRFHDGYETEVGERGMTLSGGQKQRASIAQMLFRRTKIRVFDDALSAVDARTDAQIRAAVAGERDGATVILISHRITTLMQADHIIVLEKGRIAEEGTHESLLQRNGIYRKIYELQTQGME
jgi:ATP-binding cassette subfamily B protein